MANIINSSTALTISMPAHKVYCRTRNVSLAKSICQMLLNCSQCLRNEALVQAIFRAVCTERLRQVCKRLPQGRLTTGQHMQRRGVLWSLSDERTVNN